ncbi:methyltransferase domain-containing protein [Candidatus Micrarchaeota archaeon]|nr:methyltransferase domain-containing protein [Candidatus Micrarchaeota archaeon]
MKEHARIDRDWERVYENKTTPWDVGEPDNIIAGMVERGEINPCRALELGCGNGNDAIFLARSGFDVTALDVSKLAIEEAKRRARNARAKVNFLVDDAADPRHVTGNFDFILDRCCFHFIHKSKRQKYVQSVSRLLKPSGLFILVLSSKNDPVTGPYQFSKEDIRRLFMANFDIEDIRRITLKTHKEKPQPYFCIMRKR